MANTKIALNQNQLNDQGPTFAELISNTTKGKKALATALTDKGYPTVETELIEDMAKKVAQLSTNEERLHGRAIKAWSMVSNGGGFIPLYQKQSCVVFRDGNVYIIPQYGEWTDYESMIATATFTASYEDMGISSTTTYFTTVSKNEQFIALFGSNTKTCIVLQVVENVLQYVNTYTLAATVYSNYSNTIPILSISNDGDVVTYMSSGTSYINGGRIEVLGTSTSTPYADSTVYQSANYGVTNLIKDGDKYTVYTFAAAGGGSNGWNVFNVSFTRTEDTMTRLAAVTTTSVSSRSDFNHSYSYVSYIPLRVSADKVFTVASSDGDYLLVDMNDLEKLKYSSNYLVYKTGRFPIPMYLFSTESIKNGYVFLKSYDEETNRLILDDVSTYTPIVINTATMELISGPTDDVNSISLRNIYPLNKVTSGRSGYVPVGELKNNTSYSVATMPIGALVNKDRTCVFGEEYLEVYSSNTLRLVTFHNKEIFYGSRRLVNGTTYYDLLSEVNITSLNAGDYDYIPAEEESAESI